jgi:hypothetical protein
MREVDDGEGAIGGDLQGRKGWAEAAGSRDDGTGKELGSGRGAATLLVEERSVVGRRGGVALGHAWSGGARIARRRAASDSSGSTVSFGPALSGPPLRRGRVTPWWPGGEWRGAWRQVKMTF